MEYRFPRCLPLSAPLSPGRRKCPGRRRSVSRAGEFRRLCLGLQGCHFASSAVGTARVLGDWVPQVLAALALRRARIHGVSPMRARIPVIGPSGFDFDRHRYCRDSMPIEIESSGIRCWARCRSSSSPDRSLGLRCRPASNRRRRIPRDSIPVEIDPRGVRCRYIEDHGARCRSTSSPSGLDIDRHRSPRDSMSADIETRGS